MISFFRRVLPVLLAIGLLVYVSKDIQFADVEQPFRQADYRWVSVVVLLTLGSLYCRGKRWQQALIALGHQPTAFRATVALTAGTVASMIVPGSGEVTRCITLQRTDGVPLSHGVGSVVAERVLDLLMLGLMLLLTFVLEVSRMQQYLAGLSFTTPTRLLIILAGGALFIGLGLYGLFRHPAVRQHPFTSRLSGFFRGLAEGFMAIRRLPNPGLFVLLTLLNQVLALFIIYLLLLSVAATQALPLTAALTILSVASLGGLAVPTQGGIGTYHFLVSRALVLYGLSTAQGVVVATFMHTISFGINLIISSLSFLLIPILVQQRHPAGSTEKGK